jgi:hypothetical protein
MFQKMTRYLYLFGILFLYCPKLRSQIKGGYKGLFTQTYNQYVFAITDSAAAGQKWDGEKYLIFRENQKYDFIYREDGHPCAARSTTRMCTGKYRIKGDTLYLTSTYKKEDFCVVTEKRLDSIADGKIMIVTSYPGKTISPETFINGFDLKLNSKLIGQFRIKDTIYCEAPELESIFISCCSPHIMEWNYSPKNKKSNYFHFTLKREIKRENIFMNNCRMLIGNDGLIVMDNGYLDVKDNKYGKN